MGYLVTARHLAYQLKSDPSQTKSDPFLVRINKKDGTAENIYADQVEWFEHSDTNVDVALVVLHITSSTLYDVTYLHGPDLFLDEDRLVRENVGVANLTYTVGLFRLLTGEKRNLPICHFGAIALMPGDEKVPIRDWTDPEPDPKKRRRIFVEAYLVEAQSVAGLSGSPVFVRLEENVNFGAALKRPDGSNSELLAIPRAQLRLLGLWQGAWEAPPDEVKAAQSGTVLVPVGMGVVVPCAKIIELLDRKDVKEQREKFKQQSQPPAAEPQSVPRPKPQATEVNPRHREDFNRLLGAAVKPPKSDGQT
jgi:hypothetical protein